LRAAPHARLEVMPGVGHFPQSEDPVRFVEILEDFVATSEPATTSPDEQRLRLRRGPASGSGPAPDDRP